MRKNIILILSAIFMLMILSPFKVKALDNVTLVVDYEDEDFQEFYSTNIESRLDTMINTCRNHMDSDNIMLSYGLLASNIEFLCFNIDRISSAEFTVGSNQYSSTSYSSYLRANGSIDYIRLRISDLSPIVDKVNNADLNYFNFFYSSNYDSSSSEFYTNFLPNTSWATIPFYSDKDIFVFTNNNNKNNGLFINGTYIQYGETISFYANSEEMIEINSSCTDNCETTTISGLVNTPESEQTYKFIVTDGTNTILEKNYIGKGSFEYELSTIRTDTSLSFKLYQYLDNGDLELLEEKEYIVDLKYDNPSIIFVRNQYTNNMVELRIYYFINDFNNEYTYQYKIDDNEWITTDGATILDIESDSMVQARIIDGTGKVILLKNYNLLIVDPDKPYADYTLSEYRGTADFMAYVYNIGDNFYCDYKVNDGEYVDHNVCPVNILELDEGYPIYSNTFTENSTFSVRIFDADNNLVYSNTFKINYEQYVVVPKNYLDNINNYFNKYTAIIDEFQGVIQFAYDNLTDYIKFFLIAMWTIILVVVTIMIAR